MDALGYYNGTWGPLDEMTVPMNDRGCYFGDGVYDATCAVNGVIFALDEHVDRFFNSAALLEIALSYSKEELKAILNDMTARVDRGEYLVYWQATRGAGRRLHAFPSGPSSLWIMIRPSAIPDIYKKIKLITVEDTRFLHCNIKTINLIPSVIASQRAKEADCHEAVFHRGQTVTECSHSNVHIIKDGTFITHPADNLILRGIARSHLAAACDRLGIPVEEREFTLTELFDADEVITSSASTFCLSASAVDGKPAGGRAPELLKKIQDEVMREFSEATGYTRP
ncbi:MAG: aminotransferase class IV [Treponema sp.]|jgi:D-alanine transaminase|nr:aminotransferase class IV [Treponema sp.]